MAENNQAASAKQTIARLEGLSTGELIDLASRYDVDIPAGLDRVFIIEELLYLEHEAEIENNGHDDVVHGEFTGLAILPKQYNASFIEVLIRDPLWAFAFWEIKPADREQYEAGEDFDGFCLRVTPLDEGSLKPNAQASFIIMIEAEDGGRYLGFPPEDGRCFKVELCMQDGGNFTVLSESPPFKLPRLINQPDEAVKSVYGRPLSVLSGIERFSLVRSEDRQLRSKGIV